MLFFGRDNKNESTFVHMFMDICMSEAVMIAALSSMVGETSKNSFEITIVPGELGIAISESRFVEWDNRRLAVTVDMFDDKTHIYKNLPWCVELGANEHTESVSIYIIMPPEHEYKFTIDPRQDMVIGVEVYDGEQLHNHTMRIENKYTLMQSIRKLVQVARDRKQLFVGHEEY